MNLSACAGVLVWALFGIRAAFPDVAVVATTALIAAVLVALLSLAGTWRVRQSALAKQYLIRKILVH